MTRFFSYGDGLEKYKDNPAEFVFNYVDEMNKKFTDNSILIAEYQQRFEQTMRFINKTFPSGFRRTASNNARATPKSRFEALSIGSWKAIQEKPNLADETIDVSSWHLGNKFGEIIGSDGANAKSKLKGRINYVKNKLLGIENE